MWGGQTGVDAEHGSKRQASTTYHGWATWYLCTTLSKDLNSQGQARAAVLSS